jgi:hypothetical protein
MERGRFRTVPTRCPRCLPFHAVIRRSDGRRLGWLPVADYVGFLSTPPYAGWKRPPQRCPDCGTVMEVVL